MVVIVIRHPLDQDPEDPLLTQAPVITRAMAHHTLAAQDLMNHPQDTTQEALLITMEAELVDHQYQDHLGHENRKNKKKKQALPSNQLI